MKTFTAVVGGAGGSCPGCAAAMLAAAINERSSRHRAMAQRRRGLGKAPR